MAENEKRLQFLLTMMDAKGVSKYELARMLGNTPQNIFTYFKRDDMKLSVAQDIFSRLGYDLQFRLEREGEKRDVVMDVEGLLIGGQLSRLAFLKIAMSQYGIGRKEMAERLGLNYTGINRWFKVDDIAISYIYEIAEAFGLKVRIKAGVIPTSRPLELS